MILSDVAKEHASLAVQFESVILGQTFFQSVMIRIKREVGLESFRQKVVHALDVRADTWFPHLSLYYGDSQAIREKILPEIHQLTGSGEAVCLVEGIAGWLGGSLWIVRTEGPVDSWKVLETIDI